jgi:hypothetical protein
MTAGAHAAGLRGRGQHRGVLAERVLTRLDGVHPVAPVHGVEDDLGVNAEHGEQRDERGVAHALVDPEVAFGVVVVGRDGALGQPGAPLGLGDRDGTPRPAVGPHADVALGLGVPAGADRQEQALAGDEIDGGGVRDAGVVDATVDADDPLAVVRLGDAEGAVDGGHGVSRGQAANAASSTVSAAEAAV